MSDINRPRGKLKEWLAIFSKLGENDQERVIQALGTQFTNMHLDQRPDELIKELKLATDNRTKDALADKSFLLEPEESSKLKDFIKNALHFK